MPRAPHLQSIASVAPGVSTVTSYGWISARTPSNRIRRSRRTTGSADAGRRRTRSSVNDSTIAPRTWERTCSPRSATATATSRIASDRSASGPVGRLGSNRLGNIDRQTAGSLDIPFIAARARIRCSRLASARSAAARATSGSAWIPAYTTALASGAASWNLIAGFGVGAGRSWTFADGDKKHLGKGREPVDGAMRVVDRPGLCGQYRDRLRDAGPGRLAATVVGDLGESLAPGVGKVGDVGPLVLDVLGQLGQGVVRGGRRGDGVGHADVRLDLHRTRLAPRPDDRAGRRWSRAPSGDERPGR